MLSTEELQQLGLDPKTVQTHHERLVGALARGDRPIFRILDTCRIDNGGLLGTSALATARMGATAPAPRTPATGVAAFVPAAGAASRYSKPLASLIESLERGDGPRAVEMVRALSAEGASSWPLPASVRRLLAQPETAADLDAATRATLISDLSLPKALMPCVGEGLTFLAMKQEEHAALAGLAGEAFVTPPGLTARFAAAAATPAHFFEQGPALSTLRFKMDGSPAREPDGRASLVPAGHGALASLFPAVREALPAAHSLFIRNIDNVMGARAEATRASEEFLELYQLALAAVRGVRSALKTGDVVRAASLAGALIALEKVAPDGPDPERTSGVRDCLATVGHADERALWRVQLRLFHAPLPEKATVEALIALFERPLNLLGQVPNTAQDVGGTPCFVATSRGALKVCIEVPHVSAADRDAYLANSARATHFNPVFVAAEITADPAYYAEKNEDFWLLAEKSWRGRTVYYHETVLFELLGNGAVANALFVEVPRLVFNPHKALKDAVNRSVRDWR